MTYSRVAGLTLLGAIAAQLLLINCGGSTSTLEFEDAGLGSTTTGKTTGTTTASATGGGGGSTTGGTTAATTAGATTGTASTGAMTATTTTGSTTGGVTGATTGMSSTGATVGTATIGSTTGMSSTGATVGTTTVGVTTGTGSTGATTGIATGIATTGSTTGSTTAMSTTGTVGTTTTGTTTGTSTTGTTTGMTCPATEPTNSGMPATCKASDGPCSFVTTLGSDTCTCGNNNRWTCVADCPAAPMTGGACADGTGGTAGCVSGANTCHCTGGGGGGNGRTWVCAATPLTCPAAQPAPGASCVADTGGMAGCSYGTGVTTTTCHCTLTLGADAAGDTWLCVLAL